MATPTAPYSAERPLSSHSASSTSTIEKAGGDLKKSQDGSTDDLLPPITESAGFSDVLFPWRRRRKEVYDLDECATRRSVFDDPLLAKHYWPTPKYENLHRFDPNARWTFREEKAIVRKIDWRIALWACISFSAELGSQ
ncbi:hypothetical protein ACEPAH_7603 [Sanghuangporus vaninii]